MHVLDAIIIDFRRMGRYVYTWGTKILIYWLFFFPHILHPESVELGSVEAVWMISEKFWNNSQNILPDSSIV